MSDRSSLDVNAIGHAGLDADDKLEAGDAANGNRFVNDGRCFIVAKSSDEQTLTIKATLSAYGLELPDRVVTINIGEVFISPLLDPAVFNQKTGDHRGQVYVDVSSADIELGVFRFGD